MKQLVNMKDKIVSMANKIGYKEYDLSFNDYEFFCYRKKMFIKTLLFVYK